MKMFVLVKRPGDPPRHVWIENTLENLQKTVGGYIETATIAEDMVLICDEEGFLKGRSFNVNVLGMDVYGTIVMCGRKEDEFTDLPVMWEDMKKLFPGMWEVEKR